MNGRPAPDRVDRRIARPGTSWALVTLGLLITAAFTFVAVRNVDFGQVWSVLRSSDYWWLLPAFVTLAAAVLLRAVRWGYLFVPETRPRLAWLTEALLIGHFFNNVLPARAGEIARVAALNLRSGTSRAEALATVVVERAFDVIALLLLLFVALPWLPSVGWVRTAAVLAVVLTVCLAAFVVLLALYGERPLLFALRPLARLPYLSEHRVRCAAVNLAQGLAALRRVRLAAASFVLTVASWLLLAVCFWLVTLGFDLDLSVGAGILVVVATGLSLVLPSAPAGLGVFEAATVVALGAYGISDSQALSYALVLHALNFVPFVVVGAFLLNLHGGRLARRRRSGAAPSARVREDELAEPANR